MVHRSGCLFAVTTGCVRGAQNSPWVGLTWHGHHCCFRPGMRKSHEIRSDCRGQSDENQ